jgi:uncharacterized protein Yka (UPF0111/DUF47 family)
MLGLLKRILPPETGAFYSLFEENAEVCKEVSALFHEVVSQGSTHERSQHARELKHKSNAVVKKTLNTLNTTFVTPIDREDIQQLACLMNKITKKIVKATMNLEIYGLQSYTDCMRSQAETLLEATEELKHNVTLLRHISATKEITDSSNKLKEIETKGDEILHTAMAEIFSGKYDALTAIKLKELYKNIESAMDACFDVSDLIVNIALKHG